MVRNYNNRITIMLLIVFILDIPCYAHINRRFDMTLSPRVLSNNNKDGAKYKRLSFGRISDGELVYFDQPGVVIRGVSAPDEDEAFEVFKQKGIKPDYLSGLSLGEYSCLYAGGVLSLEDTAFLVRQRAQSMEKAACANPSTMFAVLGAQVDSLKAKDREFYVANLNAPGQVVISLAKDKSQEIKSQLETQGFKVIELAVSGGFHSKFMEPARSELAKVVESMNFSQAQIPIVSNFTAKAHKKPQELKDNLLKQLVSPVLWADCVRFMANSGVDSFFEVGPSKVLRGLLRKINPDLKVTNIEKAEDLSDL